MKHITGNGVYLKGRAPQKLQVQQHDQQLNPLAAQIIDYFMEEAQESNHSTWIYDQNALLLHIYISSMLEIFREKK